jgi:hypothetical protein
MNSFVGMLVLSALGGCLPLPYPPVAEEKVTEQTLKSIQPVTSTRADVLLTLADPTMRGENDSYFIYSWAQGHGGIAFLLVAPGGGLPAADVSSGSCDSLVISFSPDGRVSRIKQFTGQPRSTSKFLPIENSRVKGEICRDPDVTRAIDDWLRMKP